ncbi:hypothetical protein OHA88_42650 [Streptomyces sp. NBC_00353]|uniref:hypothetical protein n=1 Tax=Streptomyces sp. NBC_00353 TaxID=2975722 RepID=UPI002E25B776
MRERILADAPPRRGRRAPGSQPRRSPPPARRRRPGPRGAARAFVRAGGIGVPPVRWPSRSGRKRAQRTGGEACAGRFALLAHVLVGVVAERSVWTHGGRHRDVIPFSGTDLESGMYVAGPRNIHPR